MKKKIFMLVTGVCFAFASPAQWAIDSVNTAGIYPYSGGTANKAVFTNGSEWNVFDAVTNAHSWGTLSIGRSNVTVTGNGTKAYFGGGRYGYFADPVFTKNVDVYDESTNSLDHAAAFKKQRGGRCTGVG
jgi:hypothetical protein